MFLNQFVACQCGGKMKLTRKGCVKQEFFRKQFNVYNVLHYHCSKCQDRVFLRDEQRDLLREISEELGNAYRDGITDIYFAVVSDYGEVEDDVIEVTWNQ